MMCTTDAGLVGHLKTVRHMAGKRDVQHGCLHAVVLNDIGHGRNQHTCLPRESAPRLHDNLQMRITSFQSYKQFDQVFNIIIPVCHKMTATKVKPLYLTEEMAETLLYRLQCSFQVV